MDPAIAHTEALTGEKRPLEPQSHDGPDQNAASRRKTRLVSDMDEEQLKRKRQTDRKAQEAMRLRTKSRIKSLETELEAVRAAAVQREQDLQMQVHALREENAMLNARLEQRSHANDDNGANREMTGGPSDSASFREYAGGAQIDPKVTPHSVLANFCDYYSTAQSSGQEPPPSNGASQREAAIDAQLNMPAPVAAMDPGEQGIERTGANDGPENAKPVHSWPGVAAIEGQRPA